MVVPSSISIVCWIRFNTKKEKNLRTKINEKRRNWKTSAILGDFLAPGLLKQNPWMKSKNKSLVGGPFKPEFAILDGKVKRCLKPVMTQLCGVSPAGRLHSVIKERGRERERKREIWSILTPSTCTQYHQMISESSVERQCQHAQC